MSEAERKEAFDKVFSGFDKNGDGTMEKKDYKAFIDQMMSGMKEQPEGLAEKLHAKVDPNSEGTMTKDEVMAIMKAEIMMAAQSDSQEKKPAPGSQEFDDYINKKAVEINQKEKGKYFLIPINT